MRLLSTQVQVVSFNIRPKTPHLEYRTYEAFVIADVVRSTRGGYGDPKRRDRAKLLCDIRDGFVTPEQTRRDYGVDVSQGEE